VKCILHSSKFQTWGNRGASRPEAGNGHILKSGWLFPDRMEVRAHDWTPGPSIERRTTMSEYIGLDVSLKETAISVRRGGKRIWRGKCPSDPSLVADVLRKRAPAAKRVVFETGPLSVWFYHALSAWTSGDLHRRPACQGRAGHGAEQNGRKRCRRLGASGRGRLLPRGAG
jgi:hypothetical protein